MAGRRSTEPVVLTLSMHHCSGGNVGMHHIIGKVMSIVRLFAIEIIPWRGGTIAECRSIRPVVLHLHVARVGLTRSIPTREKCVGE